jgi:hypothetical protein
MQPIEVPMPHLSVHPSRPLRFKQHTDYQNNYYLNFIILPPKHVFLYINSIFLLFELDLNETVQYVDGPHLTMV